MGGRGRGATSSNPQILLGADEGGLLSVEYARWVAAATGSLDDWHPYLEATTSGEW